MGTSSCFMAMVPTVPGKGQGGLGPMDAGLMAQGRKPVSVYLEKPGLLSFPKLLLSCLFSMPLRNKLYLALKVLFWGHRLLKKKRKKKPSTASFPILRVTQMTDFHAMLRVPFRGTMEGSLTMSHVYSKQPARHSQAHTFAQRLFSAAIRHVRVFIFFPPILCEK